MAIAFNVGAGQSQNYENATTTITTAGVTTTGGSGSVFLAWVFHEASGEGFTSITDSNANSWAQVGSTYQDGNKYVRTYKCEGGTGGSSHTFTVTYSGTGGTAILVVELTGCATSNAIDQAPAVVKDTASPFSSSTTGTTAQANEMLVGFLLGDSDSDTPGNTVDSSSTPTSGWTIRVDEYGSQQIACMLATVGVSSTGTYNFAGTQTGSGEAYVQIVTVKEGTASGSITPRAAAYYRMMRSR